MTFTLAQSAATLTHKTAAHERIDFVRMGLVALSVAPMECVRHSCLNSTPAPASQATLAAGVRKVCTSVPSAALSLST